MKRRGTTQGTAARCLPRLALVVGPGLLSLIAGRWLRLRWRRRRIHWTAPQRRVRMGTLTVSTAGEHGAPILLLHGLVGSGRYWGAEYDRLAGYGRLVVPDLLGFGASPRPPSGYGLEAHLDALAACLEEIGATGRAVVVGHSLGTVIALAFAARHPAQTAAVVGFAPPLYRNPDSAACHVAGLGLMARLLGRPGPLSEAACRWMCAHRAAAAGIARFWRPDLPAPLAMDGVQHSWESYSETFDEVIIGGAGSKWLDALAVPVHLITGVRDGVADLPYLHELAASRSHVSLAVWPQGDHDLPLTDPERCLEAILSVLPETAAGHPSPTPTHRRISSS